MASSDGFMIGNIFVPSPKPTKVKGKDLRKLLPKLGLENLARVGQNPFANAIKTDMKENGFQEGRGPRPWVEEGQESPGDGSGRLLSFAELAEEHPDLFGDKTVTIDVYPRLTEEQRHALIHRAAATTAPFTEKDYYKQSMLRWRSHPGESQLDHLRGMGLEFAMLFFTPAPESAMIRTKNAKGETIKIELKPGVTSDDLWGKNKGGQKQGPVQVGAYLAEAHPRAVEAFFAAWGEDKAHSISYRELIETVTQWKEDKKMRPDLAAPPVDFDVLAEKFPQSALVKGVLGARIREGKAIQGGRDKGKGRMDQKAAEGFATTLAQHGEDGPIILARHERTAGYTSEEGLRDVETLMKCNKQLRELSFVDAKGDYLEGDQLKAVLAQAVNLQKEAKNAIARIHSRATAEAEAARKQIIEAEQKKRNSGK